MQLEDSVLENVQGGTKIPYLVQSGDTLGKLAEKFHCTVEDICKWNDIKNPDQIQVDQKLIFKF